MSYQYLPEHFNDRTIDRAERYVDGQVHANGLENFWSLLKRGLQGTYIAVEPFHLFRYLDKQVFRYKNRATKARFAGDGDRFQMAMEDIAGKRLTYEQLTGKGTDAVRQAQAGTRPTKSRLILAFLGFLLYLRSYYRFWYLEKRRHGAFEILTFG